MTNGNASNGNGNGNNGGADEPELSQVYEHIDGDQWFKTEGEEVELIYGLEDELDDSNDESGDAKAN